MKSTSMRTSAVVLVAPLLAAFGFVMGCASHSETHGRPRGGHHTGHYPEYQPSPYPTQDPAYPVNPHPEGWVVLGTTVADYEADHDTILVRGRYDDFRQLRFKVTDAPLNLHRLIVTYDNGAPEEIRVRQKLKRGAESRVIDLHGPRSGMRRIDFYYDTRGYSGERAEVTVYARR